MTKVRKYMKENGRGILMAAAVLTGAALIMLCAACFPESVNILIGGIILARFVFCLFSDRESAH